MGYSDKFKEKAIKRVLSADGTETKIAIAKELGVSKATLYKWVREAGNIVSYGNNSFDSLAKLQILKTAENASLFLQECKEYFPFYITHILTDNGLEFTDKWARGKGKVSGNHKFDKECAKPQGQLPSECKEDSIEHRLTAPYTPQTNGMVERVNGTIKNATIKAEEYDNIEDVQKDLNKFLIYYNFNRRHGSLRKELKVRTPFEAVQSWFQVKPEIFKISPDVFQDIAFGK